MQLRFGALFTLILVTLVLAACSSDKNTARTELRDASGQVVGEATLVAAADAGGVTITPKVHDLPPGIHGVHIHDVGKCDSPAFTSAGDHFNAWGKQHGLENPDGPHAGDLPDLTVEPDGTGTLTALSTLLQNLPGGENLFDGDSVALVIHAGPDDHKTDPAGDSGARIACGPIIHD